MNAAVIIPAHNRRDVTRECVARLVTDGVPEWAEVIVADDGSTDGTAEAVREVLGSITVLRGKGDWWWAGAIAAGMQSALTRGVDHVIWLNDDSRPAPGALARLWRIAQERQGIAGGMCVLPGTTEVVYGAMRCRGLHFELLPLRPGTIEDCDTVSGNMVCIPRCVVEQLGLPDARHMPHALADLDYGLRARRAGFPVLAVHDAISSAAPNYWGNHGSWLCSGMPVRVIWQSLWDRRSYGYLPAQWALMVRHWGWRGGLYVLLGVARRVPTTLLRLVLPGTLRRRWWGRRSRAWREEERLRVALTGAKSPTGRETSGS